MLWYRWGYGWQDNSKASTFCTRVFGEEKARKRQAKVRDRFEIPSSSQQKIWCGHLGWQHRGVYHIVRYILIFNVKRRKVHGMNTAVTWNFRYWGFSCVMGCGYSDLVYINSCHLQGEWASLTQTMTTAVYVRLFEHMVAVCVLLICVCVCVFYS